MAWAPIAQPCYHAAENVNPIGKDWLAGICGRETVATLNPATMNKTGTTTTTTGPLNRASTYTSPGRKSSTVNVRHAAGQAEASPSAAQPALRRRSTALPRRASHRRRVTSRSRRRGTYRIATHNNVATCATCDQKYGSAQYVKLASAKTVFITTQITNPHVPVTVTTPILSAAQHGPPAAQHGGAACPPAAQPALRQRSTPREPKPCAQPYLHEAGPGDGVLVRAQRVNVLSACA